MSYEDWAGGIRCSECGREYTGIECPICRQVDPTEREVVTEHENGRGDQQPPENGTVSADSGVYDIDKIEHERHADAEKVNPEVVDPSDYVTRAVSGVVFNKRHAWKAENRADEDNPPSLFVVTTADSEFNWIEIPLWDDAEGAMEDISIGDPIQAEGKLSKDNGVHNINIHSQDSIDILTEPPEVKFDSMAIDQITSTTPKVDLEGTVERVGEIKDIQLDDEKVKLREIHVSDLNNDQIQVALWRTNAYEKVAPGDEIIIAGGLAKPHNEKVVVRVGWSGHIGYRSS
ncbi:hypothetical protein ACNO8S_16375 (plasmid) [Haloarcula sp. KBTZ06]|uniref:hypothetical protein n=1 Tax=Haloarcula sp. KBTZ06 TaxID=3402682 RepID=UPI003B43A113